MRYEPPRRWRSPLACRTVPIFRTVWVSDWEQAFLEADSKTVHGHSQWRLQEMLKTMAVEQPKLCADWFERRLVDDDPGWRGSWLTDVERRSRPSTTPARASCPTEGASNPKRTRDLLPHLLGHDADLAARLLGDGTLDAASALDALSGERDGGVEILGPVLLAHGVPAARIARRVCGNRSWSGNESDAIRLDIEWFQELAVRTPTLQPVSAAALIDLTASLEMAVEEERREAIRGWE